MRPGQPVVVHHDKPWRKGRPITLRGWVERYDGKELVVGRRFRSPGFPYDGLEAVQEAGDRGLIELRRGAWVSRRRYFRANGRLIGDLYNVQTATTFARDGARYVDLEIDVAYLPHRAPPVVIQDEAELEAAMRKGGISAELGARARWIAEELVRRLESGDPDWDVRPTPSR